MGVALIAFKHLLRGDGIKVSVISSLSLIALILIGDGRIHPAATLPLTALVATSSVAIDRIRHSTTLNALLITGASPSQVKEYRLYIALSLSVAYVLPLTLLKWQPLLYVANFAVFITACYVLMKVLCGFKG